MPEIPNFETLAWAVKNAIDDHPSLSEHNMRLIAEQLRLVWNARGAADIAKVESVLYMEGQRAVRVKTVDRALRSLDR